MGIEEAVHKAKSKILTPKDNFATSYPKDHYGSGVDQGFNWLKTHWASWEYWRLWAGVRGYSLGSQVNERYKFDLKEHSIHSRFFSILKMKSFSKASKKVTYHSKRTKIGPSSPAIHLLCNPIVHYISKTQKGNNAVKNIPASAKVMVGIKCDDF